MYEPADFRGELVGTVVGVTVVQRLLLLAEEVHVAHLHTSAYVSKRQHTSAYVSNKVDVANQAAFDVVIEEELRKDR